MFLTLGLFSKTIRVQLLKTKCISELGYLDLISFNKYDDNTTSPICAELIIKIFNDLAFIFRIGVHDLYGEKIISINFKAYNRNLFFITYLIKKTINIYYQ